MESSQRQHLQQENIPKMLCITVFLYANKGLLCTDRSQLYQLSVSRAARTFMLTEIYKAFHSVLHTCNFKNIWHLSTNFDSFQLLKTEKLLLRDMQVFLMGEGKLNGIFSQALTPELWYHGLIPPYRVSCFCTLGTIWFVLQYAAIEDIALTEFLFSFCLFIWYTHTKIFGDTVFSPTWLPSLKPGFGFFFQDKFLSFIASDFTKLANTMDYSYSMKNSAFKIFV